MKKAFRTALLTCLALVLLLGASVGPSHSYFTTYVTALGGYTLYLENVDTDVWDDVEGNVKSVQILSTGEDECYVRVRLFYPEGLDIVVNAPGWTYYPEDGYYYYDAKLGPKGSENPSDKTSMMTITIDAKEGLDLDYDVIVVSECIPVLNREDGTPWPNTPENPGWNLKMEVTGNEG